MTAYLIIKVWIEYEWEKIPVLQDLLRHICSEGIFIENKDFLLLLLLGIFCYEHIFIVLEIS